MKELNIEIISIIMAIKSITYISAGMILTGVGIIFTFIGTLKQGKEKDAFQTEITESGKKSIELAEKLADQTKKSSEELAEQSEKSTQKIIQLSDKNVELTQKLTEISEEKFRRLTIPSMNVINIEESVDKGLKSFFKITAKNTGNNDCLDARLIIDKHNSPLVGSSEIQNFTKVPKDASVAYKIPLFQSDLMVRIADDETKKNFDNVFFKNYQMGQSFITIFFHFEYEWNNETLKSSQYLIMKSVNEKYYATSSEEYMTPPANMSKWKK